jgi:hypothetical protein
MFGEWNPLADDGDAFRLAVKLRMQIDIDPGDTAVLGENLEYASEQHGVDPYAATRRAIVRAAASIGSTKSTEVGE